MATCYDIEEVCAVIQQDSHVPAQIKHSAKTALALLNWFVGQVMKSTNGRANPQLVREILKQEL